MDRFYSLNNPTLKDVQDILLWAYENGLRTDVDMLKGSMIRKTADKSFDEVLGLMKGGAVGFFKIILRHQMNVFGVLSDHLDRRDILELFIRNIEVDGAEYFIFIYMDPQNLSWLQSHYSLRCLSA